MIKTTRTFARVSTFVASAALLALAGCNKGAEQQSTAGGPGVTSADTSSAAAEMENQVDVSPVPQNAGTSYAAYIQSAAVGDLFEIESSKLALNRSKSAPIKAFAQQMIDAHMKTSKGLADAIAKDTVQQAPPHALDTAHLGMMRDLEKASDADFDKAYLSQQATAHQDALKLHSAYAHDGDQSALRSFAADTVPKIQRHIDMLAKIS